MPSDSSIESSLSRRMPGAVPTSSAMMERSETPQSHESCRCVRPWRLLGLAHVYADLAGDNNIHGAIDEVGVRIGDIVHKQTFLSADFCISVYLQKSADRDGRERGP